MLNLSEVVMQGHGLENFEQLLQVIKGRALDGELHFRIDVKPPYPDTPDDWEERLEMAFYERNQP
jgi:hypothetical protein